MLWGQQTGQVVQDTSGRERILRAFYITSPPPPDLVKYLFSVCVRVCVCVRARACVCMWERERETYVYAYNSAFLYYMHISRKLMISSPPGDNWRSCGRKAAIKVMTVLITGVVLLVQTERHVFCLLPLFPKYETGTVWLYLSSCFELWYSPSDFHVFCVTLICDHI